MKKLLLLIVVSIFSLNVYAHRGASAIRGVRWTPVNIVAFPIALFDPGMRKAGYPRSFIDTFVTEATAGNYDDLLATVMRYVVVE